MALSERQYLLMNCIDRSSEPEGVEIPVSPFAPQSVTIRREQLLAGCPPGAPVEEAKTLLDTLLKKLQQLDLAIKTQQVGLNGKDRITKHMLPERQLDGCKLNPVACWISTVH